VCVKLEQQLARSPLIHNGEGIDKLAPVYFGHLKRISAKNPVSLCVVEERGRTPKTGETPYSNPPISHSCEAFHTRWPIFVNDERIFMFWNHGLFLDRLRTLHHMIGRLFTLHGRGEKSRERFVIGSLVYNRAREHKCCLDWWEKKVWKGESSTRIA
jgi:hypothetical protein